MACCGVLQCVAVCCVVLQCVCVKVKHSNEGLMACCGVLRCVTVCYGVFSVSQCVKVEHSNEGLMECCGVLRCIAVCCSVLQCVAVCRMNHTKTTKDGRPGWWGRLNTISIKIGVYIIWEQTESDSEGVSARLVKVYSNHAKILHT